MLGTEKLEEQIFFPRNGVSFQLPWGKTFLLRELVLLITYFCYCPKYCFRLIEGQQSAGVGVKIFWVKQFEILPASGLEPLSPGMGTWDAASRPAWLGIILSGYMIYFYCLLIVWTTIFRFRFQAGFFHLPCISSICPATKMKK